ncbi:MAG: hypothetical protein ACK4G4_00840 [Thermus sp.]|uniref:hypothetical protein n=1 Tax=Thermus TaxID=270 RepID=UPI001FAAA0B3|nr:hypothetical protein [Thermus neutrinimicus]
MPDPLFRLRRRSPGGETLLLPLPQSLPGQKVGDLFLSQRPEEVYEAQGNILARFSLQEGEVLEVRFSLKTEALKHLPPWGKALLPEPPEAWPGILAHKGHKVERALGFLLSGQPHAWYLVDGLPLDPLMYQALQEDPSRLLPLGVAPHPLIYLGGHEGKRLLILKAPWPGDETLPWDELHPVSPDPLPFLRGLAFTALGLSALGFPTGPWPYLPYLGLLAWRQGPALKALFLHSPRHALESLLFHAFALSVTGNPRPELGLGYLALFIWNRLRPSASAPPGSPSEA